MTRLRRRGKTLASKRRGLAGWFGDLSEKKRRKVIVGTVLMGFLVWAANAYILRPWSSHVRALERDFSENEMMLQEARQIASQYAKFKREAAETEEGMRRVRKRLPDDGGRLSETMGMIVQL